MAVGDKITTTPATSAMNKIREMQSKWGISQTNKSYVAGNKIVTTDAKDLYTWLTQAKNKSGWTGTVPTQLNVSTNTNITNVFDLAYSTAESIRTYCACNCNYCSCNCNRCGCDCNDCCNDGNNSGF